MSMAPAFGLEFRNSFTAHENKIKYHDIRTSVPQLEFEINSKELAMQP